LKPTINTIGCRFNDADKGKRYICIGQQAFAEGEAASCSTTRPGMQQNSTCASQIWFRAVERAKETAGLLQYRKDLELGRQYRSASQKSESVLEVAGRSGASGRSI
jgi:hypothetical protein